MSAPAKQPVRVVHAERLLLFRLGSGRWTWQLVDDGKEIVAESRFGVALDSMVAHLAAVFELDATVEWYVRRIERGTLKTMETVNGRSLLVEIQA